MAFLDGVSTTFVSILPASNEPKLSYDLWLDETRMLHTEFKVEEWSRIDPDCCSRYSLEKHTILQMLLTFRRGLENRTWQKLPEGY